MKKILFIIGLALLLFTAWAEKKPTPNSDESQAKEILLRTLPDSIYSLINDKPIIYYSIGHYGYSWSILARLEDGIRIFSGRTSYNSEHHISEPTQSNIFDTIVLLKRNEALISWGFDTIATDGKNMEPIMPEHYVNIYESLCIIDSCDIETFGYTGAIGYKWPDSLNFNEKYNQLTFLMRWITQPDLRPYIPDSIILKK